MLKILPFPPEVADFHLDSSVLKSTPLDNRFFCAKRRLPLPNALEDRRAEELTGDRIQFTIVHVSSSGHLPKM
jgi:hypothetical protein